MSLSPDQLERYSRQVGRGVLSPEGQERLAAATVLISRAGGVGGATAMALATAGVGRIILAHGGVLESPDLNRQTLGSEAGLNQPRAQQFAARLKQLNRFLSVEAIDAEPDDVLAAELARQSTVVLSCAPRFEERLRLNAAAVAAGVPLVDAAQWGMMATLVAVDPGRTACLGCLYPEVPPFEESFPVVGAISAAIGSLAALETIKIIAGTGQPLFGRMLLLDALNGNASHLTLQRDPACRCCASLNP